MRFGLGISTCREGLAYPSNFADLQQTTRLAQNAERLGFDSLWGNDHLATQRVVLDMLPTPPAFYEPLTAFAFLAGQVPRLSFVVATIVAPLRDPVLLAKQAATLDQASQGRLILGLGIGAYREEFEAIANRPAKANRGRMMTEMTDALRSLFDCERSKFDGEYYHFSEIQVFPKPYQSPFPIYLSGNSPQAVQRVAAMADGWILASASPDKFAESAAHLRTAAVAAGRRPEDIQKCLQLWVGIGESAESARRVLDRSQHMWRLNALKPDQDADQAAASFMASNLLGTPEQITERIRAYQDAGVDHLGLIFLAEDVADLADRVQLFGEAVLPHFR